MVCATSNGSDQPAHTRSLIRAFASRSIFVLHVLFLSSFDIHLTESEREREREREREGAVFFKNCIVFFFYLFNICLPLGAKIIWKNGFFRNRENQLYKKTADSVL